jgi:hypothetical protein
MKEWVGFFILWVGPALLLASLWIREFVIHRNEPYNPNNGFSPRVAVTLWILISLFIWPISAGNYLVMQYVAHGGLEGD